MDLWKMGLTFLQGIAYALHQCWQAIVLICCAGIVASAVLAINVVVNYQQKLADFLVDLASESGPPANPENKIE